MKKLIAIALCAMTLFATFAAIPASAKVVPNSLAVSLEEVGENPNIVSRSPLMNRLTGMLEPAKEAVATIKATAANGLMPYSVYDQKVRPFLTDPDFKFGVSWGSSQRPKLSSWSCTGCAAFCADYVAYVFGYTSSPWSHGVKYYNPAEIRAGDVLYFVNGDHWVVCVERIGSQLDTLEGNWGGKVVLSIKDYTINNGTVYRNNSPFRTFCFGLHYVE